MSKLSDAFSQLEHALNPNLARALTAPEPDTVDAHLAHVVTYLRILTRHVEMLARSHAVLALEHHPELTTLVDAQAHGVPAVDVVAGSRPLEPLTRETKDIPPNSTVRDPEDLIL